MRRFGWIVLALALLAACFAPAATTQAAPVAQPHVATVAHQPSGFFDKTRFLLHMGLAYYAFHHWVINPYKAHAFNSGQPHRTSTIVKAGLATLFAFHELKTAYDIANKSSSKTLHALVAPLNALIAEANKVGAGLKKGNYNASGVSSLVKGVGSFGDNAASSGFGIKDIPIKIPGL